MWQPVRGTNQISARLMPFVSKLVLGVQRVEDEVRIKEDSRYVKEARERCWGGSGRR